MLNEPKSEVYEPVGLKTTPVPVGGQSCGQRLPACAQRRRSADCPCDVSPWHRNAPLDSRACPTGHRAGLVTRYGNDASGRPDRITTPLVQAGVSRPIPGDLDILGSVFLTWRGATGVDPGLAALGPWDADQFAYTGQSAPVLVAPGAGLRGVGGRYASGRKRGPQHSGPARLAGVRVGGRTHSASGDAVLHSAVFGGELCAEY